MNDNEKAELDQHSRTRLLIGDDALQKLQSSHVAVFGVGGVGGYVVEVLARSGVGLIDIIDNDTVCTTNINRQIIATHSTIGRLKVDVAAERIHDINPQCVVKALPLFFTRENADSIDFAQYNYVVDCIDTVTAKLEIIRRCHALGTPVISSMGAAFKMDAAAFRVADINDTAMDPLAKVIRKKLRKEGIDHLKVVYSDEMPMKNRENTPSDADITRQHRPTPASNAFVPAAAGIIIGGEVVRSLIKNSESAKQR